MSENVVHGFKFAKGKNWVPYTGSGGSDAFPFDGIVEVNLVASSTYSAKKNERGETPPMIKIQVVATDDADKTSKFGPVVGLKLISDLHLDGTDRNGDWMGRQFLAFMHSCGTSQENINKMAEANTEVPDANSIVKKYMADGKKAYVEIDADIYDGRETTKIRNWKTKEQYEQAKLIGAHQKKRRSVGQGANAGAAAGTNLGGASSNGAAASGGAAAGAGGGALPLL